MQAVGGAALSTSDRAGEPVQTDRDEPVPSPRGPDPGPRPWASRRAVVTLAGVGATAVLIDFLTKQWALAELADAEPVRLFGGTVYLVYTTNSGAAFSILDSYTFIFPVIAALVIGWIGWMALKLRSNAWAWALGLVFGGATGNLIDRIVRPPSPFQGEVIDMISLFDPYGRTWPIFNVSDSALVLGVALAIWLELTGRRRDGTRVTTAHRDRGGRRR